MQDETATETEISQPAQTNEAVHKYFEVGNDLLAKPNTLTQILMVRGMPATVVFCNSPSEADMVEVMLKKKSVPCEKLIGNVPHQRVIEEINRLQNGEISTLIITDVAARDLEVDGIEMVVNYGIHEDPEIYLHRITGYETCSSLKEVICLVSPLDFGNFHYLRKVVSFDFEKEELPSDAEIALAQSELLFAQADEGAHLTDEATQSLLASVLEHKNKDNILAMFIHNTIKVIPELHEEISNARDRGGKRGGRGRDNRDSRDNNRQGRDRGDRGDNRGRRGNDYHGSGRDDERSGGRRERDTTPPKRNCRLYIGHGSNSGFSEEVMNKIITGAELDPENMVKRLSVRDRYSFLDVPEEVSEELLAKIDGAKVDESDLMIRKATMINLPREESDTDSSNDSNENSEDQSMDSDTSSQPQEAAE